MAVAWTTITNDQVAAGAPVTTALMTALRDNPEGIAQRAAGAPKAFNVPYNYQEFTANGTWTKPTDAETGDVVIVEIVGGGEGGYLQGGNGGTGLICHFDIDDLGATEAVVVGAGGSPGIGGGDGGKSSFGTAPSTQFRAAYGGAGVGATASFPGIDVGAVGGSPVNVGVEDGGGTYDCAQLHGGLGATSGTLPNYPKQNTVFGGGGGGYTSNSRAGGNSGWHGRGGKGNNAGAGEDGEFPGGGAGGGAGGAGGTGGDGVVRVYCIKRN